MLKTFALAAALTIAVAPAFAADLVVSVPTVPVATGFNWEGAYVGGALGLYPDSGDLTISGQVGYNFLPSENLILGIEGSGLFYLDGTGDSELYVHGKAGVVVDKAIIYATSGLGTYNFGTTPLWDVGAGAEFAVTDHLSIDGEIYGRNVVGSLPTVLHVQAGIRYHF
jgi:outer membrane immunogenic protein